jgi:hypothetical protein
MMSSWRPALDQGTATVGVEWISALAMQAAAITKHHGTGIMSPVDRMAAPAAGVWSTWSREVQPMWTS